jgi:hypothetical protein
MVGFRVHGKELSGTITTWNLFTSWVTSTFQERPLRLGAG